MLLHDQCRASRDKDALGGMIPTELRDLVIYAIALPDQDPRSVAKMIEIFKNDFFLDPDFFDRLVLNQE